MRQLWDFVWLTGCVCSIQRDVVGLCDPLRAWYEAQASLYLSLLTFGPTKVVSLTGSGGARESCAYAADGQFVERQAILKHGSGVSAVLVNVREGLHLDGAMVLASDLGKHNEWMHHGKTCVRTVPKHGLRLPHPMFDEDLSPKDLNRLWIIHYCAMALSYHYQPSGTLEE